MKEKRIPKAYKISEVEYQRAKKKAIKNNQHLASLIEQFVISYGNSKK